MNTLKRVILKGGFKMVIINTFKPREFALNDITANCNYSLGGKERKGVFVVQFFHDLKLGQKYHYPLSGTMVAKFN